MSLTFHHMGLLTGTPDIAAERLASLGYCGGPVVFDPDQDVILRMFTGAPGVSAIELVTPNETNIPLTKLLRRRDDYMYHLCFATSSIQEGINRLGEDVVVVSPPKPATLFGGSNVSFCVVPGLGLIELLEQSV